MIWTMFLTYNWFISPMNVSKSAGYLYNFPLKNCSWNEMSPAVCRQFLSHSQVLTFICAISHSDFLASFQYSKYVFIYITFILSHVFLFLNTYPFQVKLVFRYTGDVNTKISLSHLLGKTLHNAKETLNHQGFFHNAEDGTWTHTARKLQDP